MYAPTAPYQRDRVRLFLKTIVLLATMAVCPFLHGQPAKPELSDVRWTKGCVTKGSPKFTFTPDKRVMSFLLFGWGAQSQGQTSAPAKPVEVSCIVSLTLQPPPGMAATFRAADYRGFFKVEPLARGELAVRHGTASSWSRWARRTSASPADNPTLSPRKPPSSECGRPQIFQIEIRATAQAPAGKRAMVRLDSIDLDAGKPEHVSLKPCGKQARPPKETAQPKTPKPEPGPVASQPTANRNTEGDDPVCSDGISPPKSVIGKGAIPVALRVPAAVYANAHGIPAYLVCGADLSNADCVIQAHNSGLCVKRASDRKWKLASTVPRYTDGAPDSCAAKAVQGSDFPPRGQFLTYCVEPALGQDDFAKVVWMSRATQVIAIKASPTPAASPAQSKEEFDSDNPNPPAPEAVDQPEAEPAAPKPPKIESPDPKAPVQGKTVVRATVSGAVAVHFFLDKDTKPFQVVDGAGPDYRFDWDPKAGKVPNGQHSITAVAFDESHHASDPSEALTITVKLPAEDLKTDLKKQSPTSVTISWTTAEPASSVVKYWTGGNDSHEASDTHNVTAHSVTLSDLTPWTAYHYQASSSTDKGVVALSPAMDFTTDPVAVTKPAAGDTISGSFAFVATGTSKAGVTARFTLDKDKPIGASMAPSGNTFTVTYDTAALENGDHTLTVTVSAPGQDQVTTAPLVFRVSNAPVITGLKVDNVTETGARISWRTPNHSSTREVAYGTAQNALNDTALSKSPATSDVSAVDLANLRPSTTYHFQARAKQGDLTGTSSGDLTFVTKPSKPDAVEELTEGSFKIVSHYGQGNADKIRVRVSSPALSNQVQDFKEASVPTEKKVTVELDQPLSAESKVTIVGVNSLGEESDPLSLDFGSSVLDWGRVRAYFTFGMVLASNTSFSSSSTSASPFLSFNIDKNWIRPKDGKLVQRLRANTYFDARLTQIATSAAPNGNSSNSGNNNNTPQTPATVTSFLANKQAGSLQIGVYFPILIARWHPTGGWNSLFLAPIAKTGFYTTNDNPISGATLLTRTGFYKFYGWGLRVGHESDYRFPNGRTNTDRAAEIQSYLDVLVGRWGNFESVNPLKYGGTENKCQEYAAPSDANCFLRQQLWRYAIEGVLKVPHTPFILGFSGNIAAQHVKGPGAASIKNLGLRDDATNFIAPPDDLRFLFGVRFNAKTLLAPLVKSVGTP